MKKEHASMINKSLTKQTRLLGTSRISKKRRGVFGPEEKIIAEAIK